VGGQISMSQELRILQYLQKADITPLQALDKFGCFRLAARISDLRDRGHKIETTMIDQGDKRFASYHLQGQG
jgi:hypothetical protein